MTNKKDDEPILISREFALVLYRALMMVATWLKAYLKLGQGGEK